MAICVYKVQSTLSQVTQDHIHDYLHAIEAELGDELRMVSMEEFAQQDFGLVFVASGGSEGIFLSQYEQISDKPVYILTSGESQYVYVVEGDTARYVEVTTGLTGSGITEITSGLTAGQQLVTVGQAYLHDGDVVRVVGGDAAQAPAGEE